MAEFLQHVMLGETLQGHLFVRNSAGEPRDADSAPGYRIYGPDGLMQNGTGSISTFLDEKDISTVTVGTNEVTINSTAHGITVGTVIKVSGVSGLTPDISSTSNYYAVSSVVNANSFKIPVTGVSGTPGYSTAKWHVAGLYTYSHAIVGASGYERSKKYLVLGSATVETTSITGEDGFIVV